MSWNYRVIKRKHVHDGQEHFDFVIKEVYYNDDDSIWLITEDAMSPMGETRAELRNDLKHMTEALELPVLKEWEIKFSPRQVRHETE